MFDDVKYNAHGGFKDRFGVDKWREQLCDSIHFKAETYGVWCDEMLIPYLKKEWGIS